MNAEELERSLGEVFSYRKVGQQFRIEGMAGKRVDWERKQVEAVRENDLLTRKEYMVRRSLTWFVSEVLSSSISSGSYLVEKNSRSGFDNESLGYSSTLVKKLENDR